MTDNERFEEICKPAFAANEKSHERIEAGIQDILGILKGSNGDPGICERLRDVEKAILPDLMPRLEKVEQFQKGILGSIVVIGGAILTEIGAWIWGRISGQ